MVLKAILNITDIVEITDIKATTYIIVIMDLYLSIQDIVNTRTSLPCHQSHHEHQRHHCH
jgi:hypothetical protein